MNKFNLIFKTEDKWSFLIARLSLGVVILPHGLQKSFGLFGGYGFSGTMNFFTDTLGIPWVFAFLAIVAELVGGLSLIFGLASRIAAFGVGVTMLVAMFMVHLEHGFFMNWFGNQKGEGFEFFILAVGLSIIVLIEGGGKFSIDKKLST